LARRIFHHLLTSPSLPPSLLPPSKGLALGNGWVDPKLQTASYSSYAFSHSLVDDEGREWLEGEFKDCLKRIDLGVGEEVRE